MLNFLKLLPTIAIALLAACAQPPQMPGGGMMSPSASPPMSNNPVTFRVRFWDYDTLPSDLQHEVLAIMRGDGADVPGESNFTAAFARGAVSRNLDSALIDSWRRGGARTIPACVTGRAIVPGLIGWQGFSACRGQNVKAPSETYVEWVVDRALAAGTHNPTMQVWIMRPAGYEIVYWANKRDGGARGFLSTRGEESGENEILSFLRRNGRDGNINFILRRAN